jgi:hypothetical protein
MEEDCHAKESGGDSGERGLLPTRGVSNLFLDDVLSRYCGDFLGVYSNNTLPVASRIVGLDRFSVVVNLSPAQSPGSHFVVIAVDERAIYYSDPLVLSVDYLAPGIRNFLAATAVAHGGRRRRIFIRPTMRVQHPKSNYCGLFALAYVLHADKRVIGKPHRLNFEPVSDGCRDREKNVELCLAYILGMIESTSPLVCHSNNKKARS